MENENQNQEDKTRSFLLPFNNILDLEKSYESILSFYKMETEQTILKLKANGVAYDRLEPHGVAVDVASIPEGIKINELLVHDQEALLKVYESAGVIKN